MSLLKDEQRAEERLYMGRSCLGCVADGWRCRGRWAGVGQCLRGGGPMAGGSAPLLCPGRAWRGAWTSERGRGRQGGDLSM